MKNSNFRIIFILFIFSIVYQCKDIFCMEETPSDMHHSNDITAIDKETIDNYPYSSVLAVTSYIKVGKGVKKIAGTCFLIGDGFALTSAHVVSFQGNDAHKINVHFGLHGDNFLNFSRFNPTSSFSNDSVEVEKYVYSSKYDDSVNKNPRTIGEDYALIYIGDKFMNKESIKPIWYYTKPVNELIIFGYPGGDFNALRINDREHMNANYPYQVKANFHDQTDYTITFNSRTASGMSGSPVMYSDNGKLWKATAILAGSYVESPHLTEACLLTDEKLKTINTWKKFLLKATGSDAFNTLYNNLNRTERYNIKQGTPHYMTENLEEEDFTASITSVFSSFFGNK